MSAPRLPHDTELAGIKQPPQTSAWAQEQARRILPVLDGSKLETMRRRIAAALDEEREAMRAKCEACGGHGYYTGGQLDPCPVCLGSGRAALKGDGEGP